MPVMTNEQHHPNIHHPHSPQQHSVPPATTTPSPTNKENREGIASILSTILLLLAAPIIAVILTLFVFQSYQVDGPSMQNTLENNDRLIVLKLPRTIARVTGHDFIPHRYDIIVFNQQESSGFTPAETKQLIKRVIGLPGEHVVVKSGRVTIYNKEHPEGFNPDNGVPSTANNGTSQGNVDITVPAGQVFVLGDNRPNSLDSRYFGTVKADSIVGKLVIRMFPFNSTQIF